MKEIKMQASPRIGDTFKVMPHANNGRPPDGLENREFTVIGFNKWNDIQGEDPRNPNVKVTIERDRVAIVNAKEVSNKNGPH